MSLSLDTNVLVELANGRHPRVRQAYKQVVLDGRIPWICAFAAHELLFGARISGRPSHHLTIARGLFQQMKIADWTLADAEASADVRATLRKRGQTIGSIDCLIAGQALARGWTVVTSNTREFGRIEGLNVIDWTTQRD